MTDNAKAILDKLDHQLNDSLFDLIAENKYLEDLIEEKKGVFEQIKWERDVAIQQLKDLGYVLGEKPEKNKGEWRPIYQGDEIIDYRCNKCDFGSTFGRGKYRFNFCPNCGADMRGEE